MTYMSLFAGVGGFDAGFDVAGLECVCQVERDKACLKTLAKHWPHVRRISDVRAARAYAEPKHAGRIHAGGLIRPDIVCGGFPCQDLSVAGKRAGLAGGRSGLFWTARRIVSLLKPTWFVLENVPGLLSSNGGRDMRTVVASLVASGYGVAWRVLDSQYFGLAQRRKRVFLVGCLGDVRRAAEVLFERGRCVGDTPPSREAGKETADTLGGGSGQRGWSSDTDRMTFVSFAQNTREEVRILGDGSIAGALGSETGTHQQTYIASFDERNITSKGNRSKVMPGEPCHTLHESPPSVIYNVVDTLPNQGMIQSRREDNACAQEADAGKILFVLRKEIGEESFAQWGLGVLDSLQQAEVLQSGLHGQGVHGAGKDANGASGLVNSTRQGQEDLSERALRSLRENQGGRRSSQRRELAEQLTRELGAYLSLLSQQDPSLAKGLHHLWQASEGIGVLRQALSTIQDSRKPAAVQTQPTYARSGVRRLTPTEAERLQGFEDGWTAGQPDSTRYRQLGNAVSVPVARWLAERIIEVSKE